MASEIKVVAIYAPADEPLWQALKVFISAMQRQGLLNIILWDLGELSPGIDREKALDQWIHEAHLVLLLLSSNLLIMNIYQSITAQLLLQSEQDRTHILPILLRPVSWKETHWGKLAALPNNDKPVTTWRDRDVAYLSIAEGIRRVVRELQPRHLPVLQEDQPHLSAPLGYTLLQTLTVHLGPVASVAFSPDGIWLASDSWDGTIILWDVTTGQARFHLLGHTSLVYSVTFSPDGQFLASAGQDQTIRLWEVSSGMCISILQGHTGAVSSVVFSPDGKWLASGSDDHTICLWETSTGAIIAHIETSQAVLSVDITSDGMYIVSGGGSVDGIMEGWDVPSGKPLITHREATCIHSIAVSPDNSFIASGCADHTIKLRGLKARMREEFLMFFDSDIIMLRGHHGIVSSVAFQADGKVLASGSHDKTIKLWAVPGNEEIETLVGHTDAVLSVAFHPSLPLLASGSFDKTVKLWGRREEPESSRACYRFSWGQLWKSLHP